MPPIFELRRELGQVLTSRHLVYLDLNYWNHFCDLLLGDERDEIYSRLFDRLRAGVAEGTYACPIEQTTLRELLRQSDPRKRAATALAIDSLSLGGSAIASRQDRMFIEFLRFVQRWGGGAVPTLPAPRLEMWTKAPFLLGHSQYAESDGPYGLPLSLTDSEMQRLWAGSFSQLLEELTQSPGEPFRYPQALADGYNSSRRSVREQFPDYRTLYIEKVRGLLDHFHPLLGQIHEYHRWRAQPDGAPLSSVERARFGNELAHDLLDLFRTNDLSQQLPTIHIWADLMAHSLWSLSRSLTVNDLYDFEHAMAALPYYDTMLTDSGLNDILRSMDLQRSYETAVYYHPLDAMANLPG